MLILAPRKKGSTWSRVNERIIEELEAEGLIHPAGRAAIDRAKADGSWTVLDDVEALVIPGDLARALADTPGARETYEAWPHSIKKAVLWGLKSAKTPATRERRLRSYVDAAAQGELPV